MRNWTDQTKIRVTMSGLGVTADQILPVSGENPMLMQLCWRWGGSEQCCRAEFNWNSPNGTRTHGHGCDTSSKDPHHQVAVLHGEFRVWKQEMKIWHLNKSFTLVCDEHGIYVYIQEPRDTTGLRLTQSLRNFVLRLNPRHLNHPEKIQLML